MPIMVDTIMVAKITSKLNFDSFKGVQARKLVPVGSTVRYEMTKLCHWVSIGHYEAEAVVN